MSPTIIYYDNDSLIVEVVAGFVFRVKGRFEVDREDCGCGDCPIHNEPVNIYAEGGKLHREIVEEINRLRDKLFNGDRENEPWLAGTDYQLEAIISAVKQPEETQGAFQLRLWDKAVR
jgi:hypothetical protein